MKSADDAADIHLAIVLGHASHSQTVIGDLWAQARNCLDGSDQRLSAVAVYVDGETNNVVPAEGDLTLVAVRVASEGRAAAFVEALGKYKGPVGVIGRLLGENMYSRRVARAIDRDPEVRQKLCTADIIVSADPAADRAVWQFRKQTSALLMHGPFAMAAAIRQRSAGELLAP